MMIMIDDDNDCNDEKYDDDDVVDSYDYDGINNYYIIYIYISSYSSD